MSREVDEVHELAEELAEILAGKPVASGMFAMGIIMAGGIVQHQEQYPGKPISQMLDETMKLLRHTIELELALMTNDQALLYRVRDKIRAARAQ